MVNRANNAPSALLMFGKPETFSTSTSVLLVRHAWPAPLTYSLAMLADPALGSTNIFGANWRLNWACRCLSQCRISGG